MAKILLFGDLAKAGYDLLTAAGHTIIETPKINTSHSESVLTQSDEAIEAIIVRDINPFDVKYLDLLPNLKIIAREGAGFDNIPVEAAKEKGIFVTNTPGVNAQAVAELTITLLLNLIKKLPDNQVKTGQLTNANHLVGRDLSDLVVGVVGFGHIGQLTAQIISGFGASVQFTNRSAKVSEFEQVSLEQLLKTSDAVILNLPATPQTSRMINAESLALMRPDAFLINTGRGELVDSQAVLSALQNHQLAGFGADVICGQTAVIDDLLALSNVVMTDHVGVYTTGALNAMGLLAAQNVDAVLQGNEPLTNVY